jgi:peptidoglycan/LPS O-acetylase OafA/YrhL
MLLRCVELASRFPTSRQPSWLSLPLPSRQLSLRYGANVLGPRAVAPQELKDTPSASRAAIDHFYGIDLLRALSACTILIWHYQHFYLVLGTDRGQLGAFDRSIQPLYGLLFPLYEHGYWAVHAFWTISGFVFAHVYGGRATTAVEFATARFARLYPLHFITLLAITIIQSVSFALTGHYQLVASNDAIGFVQQMLFVSAWGFSGGNNFNGPIWSVSIEIAIYTAFFLIARRIFSLGLLIPAVIVFICFQIVNNQSPVNNVPLCAFFFFLGTCIYLWLVKFSGRPLMILVPSAISYGAFAYLIGSGFLQHLRFFNVAVFLIAPSVLLVGWMDHFNGFQQTLRRIRWIGDVTYSTYLWHFPIQVMILIVVTYFGLSHESFASPVTLIAWLGAVILAAHYSFRFIEKPSQSYIKGTLQGACRVIWKRSSASAGRVRLRSLH